MAVYLCFECDTLVDGDWHPCEAHPEHVGELICDECMVEFDVVPISRGREAEINKIIKGIEDDSAEAK